MKRPTIIDCGILIIFSTFLVSCGSDGVDPVVKFTSPIQSPIPSYDLGDTLRLIGKAADDNELSRIKFTSDLWTDLDTCTIEARSGSLSMDIDKSFVISEITIPDLYSLTAIVEDQANNTVTSEVAFNVIDDIDPILTLVTPSLDTTISRGDTLLISGKVSDDNKLSSLSITIDSLSIDMFISDFNTDTMDLFSVPLGIADTVQIDRYMLIATLTDDRGQIDMDSVYFMIE